MPRAPEIVECAAFSPDNRIVAVGSSTAAVYLLDLATKESRILEGTIGEEAGVVCLAFAADGGTLAVGKENGKIVLWDTATWRVRSTLDGNSKFVQSLVFAPDCATLASSSGDNCIRIWDVPTGRQRFVIGSRESAVFAVAFSPDSTLLVVGARASPVLRLWDMASESERATLCDPTSTVCRGGDQSRWHHAGRR